MTGTFTHAGPGPALTISYTDSSYTDGICALGGSVQVSGTDTASLRLRCPVHHRRRRQPDPRSPRIPVGQEHGRLPKTVAVTVPGSRKPVANPDVPVTVPAGERRLIGPLSPISPRLPAVAHCWP